MNQAGQGFGILKLAVFVIVLLAILYILTTLFIEEQKDPIEELKKSLESAQGRPGTGVTKNILFEKYFAVDAQKIFDSPLRSVSFRCNSEYCAQNVFEVGARNFVAHDKVIIQYTARCIFEKNLYNCKIYFGTTPAQVIISNVSLKGYYDLTSENVELDFFVENTGEQNAADVTTEVRVFRKEVQEGKPLENLYAEPLNDFVEILAPKQSNYINFKLPIRNSGDYVVEIKAFGLDAGEHVKRLEFSAQGYIVSPNCSAQEKLETFLNETLNKCITRYSCSGCERAFECVVRWEEKQPGTIFEISSKDVALEMNEPIDELCE